MKPCKKVRLLLCSIAVVLMSTVAHSQTLIQPDPTQEMELEARRKVEMWENELSLRAKQAALMERKFIEYALKKQELLRANLPPEQRLRGLASLKFLETTDMRDILTKPQYERYIMLLEKMAEEGSF